MSHRFHRLTALATGIALLVVTAIGTSQARGDEEHDDIAVTGTHQRQQFTAGARVRVHDAALTDAFVAGGEVSLDRVTADDVYVAGGSLYLSATRVDDLVSAGWEQVIDATIDDDLVTAGGRIRIRPGTTVAGDAVLAGGDIDLAGRVDGNVTAASGRLVVSGTVGGDVEATVSEIVIRPEARISGRLVYRSEDDARIETGAIIGGGVEKRALHDRPRSLWPGFGVAIALLLLVTLGLIILGAILQVLMPGVIRACAGSVSERPVANWLLGFGVLVAVPVAANIALVTLVGAPFGLVLYLAYALSFAVALVVAAHWLGARVSRRWHGKPAAPSTRMQIAWTAIGMTVLVLVSFVPVLGWLLPLAVVPAGAGAVISRAARDLREMAGPVSQATPQ